MHKFGAMTPLFAVASLLVFTSRSDVWFAGWSSIVEGFSSPALPPQKIRRNALVAPSRRQRQYQHYSQQVVQLFLCEEDNQESKKQIDGEDAEHDTMLGSYDGFNPFTGQRGSSSTMSTSDPFSLTSTEPRNSSTSTQQISLRNMRMQELITDLLEVVGDEERTKQVLDDSKDFLLQPLEDQEAVLVWERMQ